MASEASEARQLRTIASNFTSERKATVNLKRYCLASGAALALAGCAGTGVPSGNVPQSGSPQSATALRVPSDSGTLYVASTGVPGSVLVYSTPSLTLIRKITDNVGSPVSLTLANNHLFVVNNNHDYYGVNEYASKGAKFLKTISQLRNSEQVLVDSSGVKYVRRYNLINIYDNGRMRILRVPSYFIALDSSNNLYVSTKQNAVTVYAPGAKTPSRTITTGVNEAFGLAFDTAGDLYVANVGGGTGSGCPGSVTVYAPGATLPMRTISSAQGICDPFTLAFDTTGNLYVGNESYDGGPLSNVAVYPPGSSTLLRSITDGINDPWSLAFDQAGNLYVANRFIGTVTMYSPGRSTPDETLSNVYQPESLVVGK